MRRIVLASKQTSRKYRSRKERDPLSRLSARFPLESWSGANVADTRGRHSGSVHGIPFVRRSGMKRDRATARGGDGRREKPFPVKQKAKLIKRRVNCCFAFQPTFHRFKVRLDERECRSLFAPLPRCHPRSCLLFDCARVHCDS